ncbi:hypothetical protein DERF_006505 [Dermatophagoides farinae]|uniref:Uncharacterized protein n=2 Tax=Dermatophagoides farinae TaxID=6954 RepID=A0A922I8Z8_DERFA|nr:hypothetical protein HUG17_2792 [Dermatophagoides farinae]KAH9522951.1 hypothetical protein DERF_006505 [Dermatophagoides farinae]
MNQSFSYATCHHHDDNQSSIHFTSLNSSSQHNQRSQRSVPEFEATLNAMKCALRIVGLQVSEHHNNMFMCCGLWKMKTFMKDTADRVCENAHESKRVFDDFMTDELIYGKFTHSILGDDTLDCKKYPEGSPACERLFAFITFIVVMIILLILLLVMGCCMATVCWHRSRRQYQQLLRLKLTNLDSDEKNVFLQDHYDAIEKAHSTKRRNWTNNLKVLIPGRRLEMKQRPIDRLNQSQVDSSGKSSPDSAVPPSTNSTTTSRNTSTLTLNENHHQEKPKQ